MGKVASLVLLVVGIVLIVWGVSAMESFSSDVSRFFTGSPTNKAVWLFISVEQPRPLSDWAVWLLGRRKIKYQ